jgi:hypothetical protein
MTRLSEFKQILRVKELAKRVAPFDSTVLVQEKPAQEGELRTRSPVEQQGG